LEIKGLGPLMIPGEAGVFGGLWPIRVRLSDKEPVKDIKTTSIRF
jgi:hypothetical protein